MFQFFKNLVPGLFSEKKEAPPAEKGPAKTKKSFARQLVANAKAITELKANKQTGMSFDMQFMIQEIFSTSQLLAEKYKVNTSKPSGFEFNMSTYKTTPDSWVQLQTATIFNFMTNNLVFGASVDEAKAVDFNLNLFDIEKFEPHKEPDIAPEDQPIYQEALNNMYTNIGKAIYAGDRKITAYFGQDSFGL